MEGFEKTPMVELKSQYLKIKEQIDHSVIKTIESSQFIGGSQVETFKISLQQYLKIKYVIPCANGTEPMHS